jgi:hypothetical protein
VTAGADHRDVPRVLDLLARALDGAGSSVGELMLVRPPLVTGRSTTYFVGEIRSRPRFVVKVPVQCRTPVDTDPALSSADQFEALSRAHRWFQEEDGHSVARPVALMGELDALVIEYVSGRPLPRAVTCATFAPTSARRAVAAAGDALRRVHRHGAESPELVDLPALVRDILAVEEFTLRRVGVHLPTDVQRTLAAVPGIEIPGQRVLVHGDYVPSNLILTDDDHVSMIDPVLARVGLPEEDLARFLAVLSSDSTFVLGQSLRPLRRLRRELEETFRVAYGPAATGTVMELCLIKQHALRWRRRRELSRLADHPFLMRARSRVIDGHMRGLLLEAGERLSDALERLCRT